MIMKSLSNKQIAGISVGNSHCLAWDKKGQIYSWGVGIFMLYISSTTPPHPIQNLKKGSNGQLAHPIH